MYSDSHAHVVDYSPQEIERIVRLMREKRVDLVLAVGVNLESSEDTVKLAEKYEQIQAAVGIHPWFAVSLNEAMKQRFERLAGSKFVSAIGEVGLDYQPPMAGGGSPPPPPGAGEMKFPDKMPKLPETPPTPAVQQEVFMFEVSIARKYGLPMNIHCQGGAHQDMIDILRINRGVIGIAHSFSGDEKMLHDWLDLGFYICPAMMNVTPEQEAVIKKIPLERLVVETDANPMHSPDGPVHVIPVVEQVARIRGASVDKIGQATTENLRRVLKIQ